VSGSARVREELYHYMKERGGVVWPDDAARELGYSVLDILNALKKREGKAREAYDTGIGA